MRCALRGLVLLCCLLLAAQSAQAQLATSFYNVTGIQTRVLPNAVQLTIQTDGTVAFGGDLNDFIDMSTRTFDPKEVTSFRIRLVNAHARMPAFVDIGQYPVDSAVVTLGTDDFVNPFFGNNAQANSRAPRVDIQLRFFVPITVQRFIVDRFSSSSINDDDDGNGVNFSENLGPRDVGVELGRDRRSIIVTIMSDRVDTRGAERMKRSPAAQHKHRLSVTPIAAVVSTNAPNSDAPGLNPPATNALGPNSLGTNAPATRFKVDALHTPLADVLNAVSDVTGLPMLARNDAANVDVSLLLPEATPEEFLRTIGVAYGLNITPRAAEFGGGYDIGRGGTDLRSPSTVLERLPLRNLEPEQARLLFPDFLLPLLRADRENNALIIAGSPALVARVRSDLARLDVPRAQARVEVTAWEFSTTDDFNYALNATRTGGNHSETINSDNGILSVLFKKDQTRALSIAIQALLSRGRVRLRAKPFVVVTSGRRGTMFLGQTRFITILRQRGREQVAESLRLDVGYSLNVRPTIGAEDHITLELNPRLSTVDATEARTGLPTLGIREVNAVIRVRPDDAVLIAGLDSDLRFNQRGEFTPLKDSPLLGPIASSIRANRAKTSLVLLVTAHKV